jgi:tetratricopeptide (TPR) repeat protein
MTVLVEMFVTDSLWAHRVVRFHCPIPQCRYLSEEKKQYSRAEELYNRALQVNPRHANTLYNFAVMLDTHCNRKGEAEGLYRRCIELEPRHAFALYNLAVLLEEKFASSPPDLAKQQNAEVADFYRRAVDSDPNDATTLSDFGRLARLDLYFLCVLM